MMKIISFSAVEVLDYLLNRSKTQTIRPVMKYTNITPYFKPPRFRVGDKVKLMWKQRTKYKWFCPICGLHRNKGTKCENCETLVAKFNKLLGTAEITDVFGIKMEQYHVRDERFGYWATFSNVEELAKRDGFRNPLEMFAWFDEKYDLSEPKEFWVYRWRWV